MYIEKRCLIKVPSVCRNLFITISAIEKIQNNIIELSKFRTAKRLYNTCIGLVGYVDNFEIVQLKDGTYEIWGDVHSSISLKDAKITFSNHLSSSNVYMNGVYNVYSLDIVEFYVEK